MGIRLSRRRRAGEGAKKAFLSPSLGWGNFDLMSGYAHFAGPSRADIGARLVASKVGCEQAGGHVGGIAIAARSPFPAQRSAVGSGYLRAPGIAVGANVLGPVLGNGDPNKPFLTSGWVEKRASALDGHIDPRLWFGYPDVEAPAWQLPAGAYNYFSYGFNQGVVQTGVVAALAAGAVFAAKYALKKFGRRC